jgi:Conjugative transposon protein TcpC
VTRLRREPRERSPTSTSAGLLKALGRVVLWCCVAVLLLRGAADLMRADTAVPAAPEQPAAASAWPDDAAEAYAVEFARAYLTNSPRLEGFVGPDLLASIAPELPEDAKPLQIQTATVAESAAVDDGHALITIAVSQDDDTRLLVVPVGRDGDGGLTVYDLPSFAPPPRPAQLPATQGEPVPGADRAPIGDVVERFMRAFLAGRDEELDYLVPAGTQIGALAQPYELTGVVSIEQVGPGAADAREVLAMVRARDVASGAVFALRYRLRLVREDRWYVASVNEGG